MARVTAARLATAGIILSEAVLWEGKWAAQSQAFAVSRVSMSKPWNEVIGWTPR
jgi:hypothetical protein